MRRSYLSLELVHVGDIAATSGPQVHRDNTNQTKTKFQGGYSLVIRVKVPDNILTTLEGSTPSGIEAHTRRHPDV